MAMKEQFKFFELIRIYLTEKFSSFRNIFYHLLLPAILIGVLPLVYLVDDIPNFETKVPTILNLQPLNFFTVVGQTWPLDAYLDSDITAGIFSILQSKHQFEVQI